MSKTEDVIKKLQAGETDTAKIKAETGASDALISRCRQKVEALKAKEEPKKEEQEEEPTDEEIEAVIKQIQITPDKKYLQGKEEKDEDYKCMGCLHEWKSKTVPAKCPKCGAEF